MNIVVPNVYVAPCATLTNTLHILVKTLCNIPSNQTMVIVDFNINMLERNNKGQSKIGQSMLSTATTLRATRQQRAFILKTKTVRCG